MDAITVEMRDAVCRITLNRPERLNALGDQVRKDLETTLRSLLDDTDVRVVLVRGEGRAFSAGADLKDDAPSQHDWASRRHASGGWQRILDLFESIPQVTVASLHGYAIGGAFLVAAACDIRIAAEDTKLSIPELAIGIPLTWAGIPRLVREIGLPRARDLVMTGRTIDGREAHEWGFVQRLTTSDELEAQTEALIGELLAMPPGPLSMTRDMFKAIGRRGLELGWADADLIRWSRLEPEAGQAAADYVERNLRKK